MGKSSGEQQEPTAGGPGYKVGNFNERRKAFIAERRKVAGISYKTPTLMGLKIVGALKDIRL